MCEIDLSEGALADLSPDFILSDVCSCWYSLSVLQVIPVIELQFFILACLHQYLLYGWRWCKNNNIMEGAKKDVCRFFLKGQCKNGDRCAFEHPQNKEKGVPPPRKDPIPAAKQPERSQSEEKKEPEIKDP